MVVGATVVDVVREVDDDVVIVATVVAVEVSVVARTVVLGAAVGMDA